MKLTLIIPCFLAGCLGTEPEPSDMDEIESASSPLGPQGAAGQGSTLQGSTLQGSTLQGSTLQGSTLQGSTLQGGTHGGVAITEGFVGGTAIYFWKKISLATKLNPTTKAYYWEYRSPTRLCKYNQARTALLEPCTNYAVSASPVIGSTWPSTFVRYEPDGSTTEIPVTLRIEAVRMDTTTAMHALRGSDYATGAIVACENPNNCRKNSDMFNYDVKVIDVLDNTNQNPWLCASDQTAIALAGVYKPDGTYLQGAPGFTFACTNGVIAKCTRWGYRPFDRSIRANDPQNIQVALRGYHQTCLRAAMADYCGNGHSFTKNGTLVDIFDYEGTEMGFVPQTLAGNHQDPITAFAHEGRFDQRGATFVDDTRYHELVSIPEWNPELVCPGTFAIGIDNDEFYHYSRRTDLLPYLGPFMVVNSSPMCAHSELKTGKWLHRECSYCTNTVPAHCNDPASSRGWDQACVDAVRNNPTCMTNLNKRMALHSECVTGPALQRYDSGCTLSVCDRDASCCGGGSWTQACVNLADALCVGGGERRPAWGFCSGGMLPGDPLPPTGFN